MGKKTTVLSFINRQRINGVNDKEILDKLLDIGWPADIVLRALEHKPFEKIEISNKPAAPRSKVYRLAGGFRSF